MPKTVRIFGLSTAFLALVLLATPALAQFGEATGAIFGKVVDEQGGALPGVAVTIRGPGSPMSLFTDARGEFRALNLAPGNYTLTLTLAGFATVNRENVVVALGRNTELSIPMKLSPVAATITVTGETPVLETRKVQTGAAITQMELQSIPTARDPWVVMQSVAGVVVDRVNVAGSESGQQSNFSGKGSQAGSFAVDGVNLTDMAALGASAGYYDFDMFQEMQVITGGSDPAIQGAGTSINMVTKRGTNDVHGSARVLAIDTHFESDNLPDEAKDQALSSGNHIESIQDYGAEAGGPIWRDHLWLWGAYGRSQINLVTAGGAFDRTTLENFNAKLNWQIIPSNAFTTWFQRSDKLKAGRSAGLTRPQPTTWNQITPQNTWKFEDSHVFSSNLFATVQYNGANGNFELAPQAGLTPQTFINEEGIWANSYLFYAAPRPQRQVKGDVSFFFNTGSVGHELKAGFGYLKATASSTTIWPGFPEDPDDAFQTYGDLFDCSGDEIVPCAVITRNGSYKARTEYYSGFIGDTLTIDRLTVNAGARYDLQKGENAATGIPANQSFPTLLPAIEYPGRDKDFEWEDISPRLGLTYALGAERKTILKASYARFAAALGIGTIGTTNPLAGASYAYYLWNDANGDNLVQVDEVDTSDAGFQFGRNFDPRNPAQITPVNGIDPDLEAPKTDEIIVGIEHELLPAFAVGINYTYRKFTDFIFDYSSALAIGKIFDPVTGRVLTEDDYYQFTTITGTLPDGTSYSAPVYSIRPEVLAAIGGDPVGDFVHNRDGYEQEYNGVELILTKRLSNRWMARGSFTWNDHKQNAEGCIDPTNQISFSTVGATSCRDDDFVSVRSGGSGAKDSVYLNSRWQFAFNGLYQLPLGFNFAAAVYGREGYPINWWRRAFGPGDVNEDGDNFDEGEGDNLRRDVAVVSADSQRYEDVLEVDLRVEKVVPVTQTVNLTLSVDLFNATNENTVLQRFERLNVGNTNDIKEIQSPRIWRFGARVSF